MKHLKLMFYDEFLYLWVVESLILYLIMIRNSERLSRSFPKVTCINYLTVRNFRNFATKWRKFDTSNLKNSMFVKQSFVNLEWPIAKVYSRKKFLTMPFAKPFFQNVVFFYLWLPFIRTSSNLYWDKIFFKLYRFLNCSLFSHLN